MSLHKVKSTCVMGKRPWAEVGGGGQSSGYHGHSTKHRSMGYSVWEQEVPVGGGRSTRVEEALTSRKLLERHSISVDVKNQPEGRIGESDSTVSVRK